MKSPDFDWRQVAVLFAAYGTACAYTPDPNRPGKPLLPFDSVGRPIEEIWSQWLALDPVRMARSHADALAGMRRIYLDAGRNDVLPRPWPAATFTSRSLAGSFPSASERHGLPDPSHQQTIP